ncbi:hypothetical protein MMC10_005238 [Thelotrema lepadinum]|nr:hypothetical protein [Thelotrema lepadinum]
MESGNPNQEATSEEPKQQGRAINSRELPYADCMFAPVFCTVDVPTDALDSLLIASRPPIAEVGGYLHFCILNSRDTSAVLAPSRPPTYAYHSPFRGHSLSEIHAAFMGTDDLPPSSADPAKRPPQIRQPKKTEAADKPRAWTRNTFLILDHISLDTSDPTALVAFSPDTPRDSTNPTASQQLQTLRCDFPTTLRLVLGLEAPEFDLAYAAEHLVDSHGVVRQKVWEEYFKDGGEGLRDLGIGPGGVDL